MEEMEMSGRLFIFGLGLLVFQFTVVQGQSTTQGFLSIACGLPKDQGYNDSRGLPFISDSEFIETGQSNVVSSEFFIANSSGNYLRNFPNGTRNCYKIKPVLEGWTYLVRARFLYGNYDGRKKFPQFDLYLGINYWRTVSEEDGDVPYSYEIMVVTVSNSISICLVNTNQGTPFISALELRPLTDTLYSEANASQSLVLLSRRNLGGDFFSYPKDIYDRFWLSDKSGSQFSAVETSSTIFSILASSFAEPSDVMQSFVYPDQTATNLSSTIAVTSVGACPSTRAYFVFYFAEIESSTESRILHVTVNDVVISDDIQPEYLKTFPFEKSISFNGNQLTFSVANASGSTKPPILNALEIYRIIDMTCQSETRSHDVDAMMDVKSFYKVQRNWNGDPCAPIAYMWEGLNCSYNGSYSPLITSLNLSSSGLIGEILPSFANISALQYLDLSSNSLTGEIPDSLSRLTQLKVLNLTNNRLTGSIPKVLLDMSSNGQLKLSTGGNPNLCSKPDSCSKESSKKNNKVIWIIVISCIVVVVLVVVVVSTVVRRRRGKELLNVNNPTKFTKRKINRITDNFKEEIGCGGYGKVYLGKLGKGKQVAIKKLKGTIVSSKGVEGFQAEVNVLTKTHHKNLTKFVGYCDDIDCLALVYEYMEGRSLHAHLSEEDKRTKLSWRKRLQIAFEVAQGLKYLHKDCDPPIIHRDIKPENILLTKNLEARIADFGLSKMFENDGANATHISTMIVAGTRGYLDPQYEETRQLRDKSDVYSFGVVLLVLITGRPAITKKNESTPSPASDSGAMITVTKFVEERLLENEIREIIDKRIEKQYDEKSVLDYVQIAQACTKKEPSERPDITKVVKDLEELCTAYDNSHPQRSGDLEELQVADDVPLNKSFQTAERSHSCSKK